MTSLRGLGFLVLFPLLGLAACDRGSHVNVSEPARGISSSAPQPVAVPAPTAARSLSMQADLDYNRALDLLDCASRDGAPVLAASIDTQQGACMETGAAASDHAAALFHQAAAMGSRDAEVAVLGLQADAVLRRLASRAENGAPPPMSDEESAQMAEVVAGLEKQAFNGNALALEQLQQIMGSSVFESNQPDYAAALRLVAEQPVGVPLPKDTPLKGESMLDDLDATQARRVIDMARDIHDACCSR